MLRHITDYLPNVLNTELQVLLYHNYQLIEKFPTTLFLNSPMFCDQCLQFGIELPPLCKSAIFRFHYYFIIVKDYGEYQFIIFKPKKHYGQNSKN